jgi:hypothetical protein
MSDDDDDDDACCCFLVCCCVVLEVEYDWMTQYERVGPYPVNTLSRDDNMAYKSHKLTPHGHICGETDAFYSLDEKRDLT